jgi:hypothetical protein
MNEKYAISADDESSVAQHGRAKLLRYESDYYGNYVEVATGAFHKMADLAKKLNAAEEGDRELTLMANPTMPTDEHLLEWFELAAGPPEGPPAQWTEEFYKGLRAIWRNGCDAGMVAPTSSNSGPSDG